MMSRSNRLRSLQALVFSIIIIILLQVQKGSVSPTIRRSTLSTTATFKLSRTVIPPPYHSHPDSNEQQHFHNVSKTVPIRIRKVKNSTDNVYAFEKVTRQGIASLRNCTKPQPCDLYRGVYGFALDEYILVDTNRKILMEFTPKADCTSAVVAFLDAVGLIKDVGYIGWPHIFRERYYKKRCGEGNPCLYYDSEWFRFKVVRNPFDRAVSGYLYVMKTAFLSAFLPQSLQNASFEQFVDYQLSLPPENLQYFATRHAGPQSQYYERFVYSENLRIPNKYPPIFNEIVKAEESEEGFKRIYEKIHVQYQLNYTSTKHFQKRNAEIDYYVGNITWNDLHSLGKIPQNYGYFYNKEMIKKVEKLYEWDLLLYNYTFTFETIG